MLGRADHWLMSEYRINGQIKVREVPFASEAEWRHWWLGEFKIIKGVNTMVRLPRMSDREKERYTAAESENILVAAGITQVLNYVGATNGSTTGVAQWLAFGNRASAWSSLLTPVSPMRFFGLFRVLPV